MNVLFISNDRSIFTQSPTRARMRAYAAAFGELHILSQAPEGAREEHDGSLRLYPMTGPRLLMLFTMPGRVRQIIRKEGVEIVSAQDPFEQGWIAKEGVKGTSAKLHIQIHTDFLSPWFVKGKGFRAMRVQVPRGNGVRRMLADRVLPHADGIRVVSMRIAHSLRTRYGTRLPEPAIIPLTVEATVPVPVPLPAYSFAFVLLTVARLEPEKRMEDILMAIGRLRPTYPSLGWCIAGTGSEERRLRSLARELGLADRVIFLGDRPDARALMGSAHAYIQASAYEGYGRTLIEAALARLPIITTDVGIVGEVFQGYEDVLSAPVADPAALAVHIRGLIEDHAARTALAINAERKARAHLQDQGDLVARVKADLGQTLERA